MGINEPMVGLVQRRGVRTSGVGVKERELLGVRNSRERGSICFSFLHDVHLPRQWRIVPRPEFLHISALICGQEEATGNHARREVRVWAALVKVNFLKQKISRIATTMNKAEVKHKKKQLSTRPQGSRLSFFRSTSSSKACWRYSAWFAP